MPGKSKTVRYRRRVTSAETSRKEFIRDDEITGTYVSVRQWFLFHGDFIPGPIAAQHLQNRQVVFLGMSPSISKEAPIISGVLGAIFFGIAVNASPSPKEGSDPRENTIITIVAVMLVLQFALAFGSSRWRGWEIPSIVVA